MVHKCWNSIAFTDETGFHCTIRHTHTHRHPHTQRRDNEVSVKKKILTVSSPMTLALLLLKKLFLHVLFLHLHDEIPNVRWPQDTLCFSTSSALTPVTMPPKSQILSLYPLSERAERALVLYSKTRCYPVVTGEDNGALSAKCVWLSQIAYCRRRRWAGTDQAQCLHKHIRRTDRRNIDKQTCGAVGRIDAQKLQHRLHGGVIQ